MEIQKGKSRIKLGVRDVKDQKKGMRPENPRAT